MSPTLMPGSALIRSSVSSARVLAPLGGRPRRRPVVVRAPRRAAARCRPGAARLAAAPAAVPDRAPAPAPAAELVLQLDQRQVLFVRRAQLPDAAPPPAPLNELGDGMSDSCLLPLERCSDS